MAPVIVDVPFESSTLKAVVRQYIGIGTLNVKTARGEVKAQTTDIIMTFIERLNDADEIVPVEGDRVKEGYYTMVYPEDLFFALFPDAEITTKMKASNRVLFDKDGEAVFIDDEGKVTSYEGDEILDTPENRTRWPGVWTSDGVVIREVPIEDSPASHPFLPPADQGALNRLIIDKLYPVEQPPTPAATSSEEVPTTNPELAGY